VHHFQAQLCGLTQLVEEGNEEKMQATLSRIRRERLRMFP